MPPNVPCGREMVIESMAQMKCRRGQIVIRQGDQSFRGNFYAVDSGNFEVFKRPTDPPADTELDALGESVLKYSKGGAFGELALMYNVPRQVTV